MSDEHETNVLDYDGCDCDGQTDMAVWVRLCVPGGADPWRNTCPWACPMAGRPSDNRATVAQLRKQVAAEGGQSFGSVKRDLQIARDIAPDVHEALRAWA